MDWLRLDAAADDWYDGTRWQQTPWGQTAGELFATLRDRAESMAPSEAKIESRSEEARAVECPDCGASPGSECQRPSGHTVRESHKARVEAASEDDDCGPTVEQATLLEVSGGA